jgi:hypothetical protein
VEEQVGVATEVTPQAGELTDVYSLASASAMYKGSRSVATVSTIPGDGCHKLGVAARVSEGREYPDLGNVSKGYNAVSNRSWSRRDLLSSGSECCGNETFSQRIR